MCVGGVEGGGSVGGGGVGLCINKNEGSSSKAFSLIGNPS